jgi:hypothetical protein
MLSTIKIVAIAGGIGLATTLIGSGIGYFKGVSVGEENIKQEIEAAKAESQETINLLSSEVETLRQENQRLQWEGQNETVRYVERRGIDPACYDDDGMHILSRYRKYPAQPNK